MLRRIIILAILVCGIVASQSSSAWAILNGQPDGNAHPYVGMVIAEGGVCSGAAISPTVFITAAHCFAPSEDVVNVTFDPNGLSADAAFVSGRWLPHPDHCTECVGGLVGFDSHDIAVVILEQPVELPAYASLPSSGAASGLGPKTSVEIVGYGIQDRVKDLEPHELFTRYQAVADLVQQSSRLSRSFLKVTANPARGKGGTCFGDSGGPVLAGTTILGVNAFVTNDQCAGVTYAYRVDTDEALTFIHKVIVTHAE